MPEKKSTDGQPVPYKKYTSAFKTEGVRYVTAGTHQSDVARAQGISSVSEQAVSSSAEREEIKRLRAELKRVEIERDMLRKMVTLFALSQS